jgi:NAD(P)H-nitrite reductase large subunit
MKQIVIIGNGIAGITAARHIRKRSDYRIQVISSESPYFFSRTALMYIYMGHQTFAHTKPYEDFFWDKNRIERVHDLVKKVDFQSKTIELASGDPLPYDDLIIATGSKPHALSWPGLTLKGVQGLYHLQDLEQMEENTRGIQRAVVVGGGLIGIEMAEMLHSRQIPVTYLVRESGFWNNVLPQEESALINRHIREHGIDLRLQTELDAMVGDDQNRVRAVATKAGEEIPCQFVGLTIGVSPNVDFLKNSDLIINRGIVVDEFLRTNISDVYAIGDCAELQQPAAHRKAIEAVWYTGRQMGETVAATLCGSPTPYWQGVWFNSAKFFDIEYQTYGHVPPVPTEGQASFYWEHANGKKCLRLVFDAQDESLLGVNVLGIRLRHLTIEQWIASKTSIREVLSRLEEAHFDPEFYVRHEDEIRMAFQHQFPGVSLSSQPKKGLFSRLFT